MFVFRLNGADYSVCYVGNQMFKYLNILCADIKSKP